LRARARVESGLRHPVARRRPCGAAAGCAGRNPVLAVAGSECEFYRNGTWYDPKFAADHLSTKFKFLLAKNLVQSAEDFIEKAASRSSMSGQAYAIRCKGGAAVPTSQWLLILLARYRESLADALKRN
jgi:hypothetical protein